MFCPLLVSFFPVRQQAYFVLGLSVVFVWASSHTLEISFLSASVFRGGVFGTCIYIVHRSKTIRFFVKDAYKMKYMAAVKRRNHQGSVEEGDTMEFCQEGVKYIHMYVEFCWIHLELSDDK